MTDDDDPTHDENVDEVVELMVHLLPEACARLEACLACSTEILIARLMAVHCVYYLEKNAFDIRAFEERVMRVYRDEYADLKEDIASDKKAMH